MVTSVGAAGRVAWATRHASLGWQQAAGCALPGSAFCASVSMTDFRISA